MSYEEPAKRQPWHVSLHVHADELDYDWIAAQLPLKKTVLLRASEPDLAGTVREFRADGSREVWSYFLSSRQYKAELNAQLIYWYDKLSPHGAALRRFRARGYRCFLDCGTHIGFGQPYREFRIESGVLAKLAALGIELRFVVFSHWDTPFPPDEVSGLPEPV